MAIDTWFNVQKWVDHDWVDRSRVIREEVIYDPNRKPK
jgi:hypothetical protein